MMNPTVDSVDEVVDQFEIGWSPRTPSAIRETLRQFGLMDNDEAITELIRIDIERRYCSGLSCRLQDYLVEFPSLLNHPDRTAEIAFEDYRVCTQLGHPIRPDRYRDLPDIESQAWYREFQQEFQQRHLNGLRSERNEIRHAAEQSDKSTINSSSTWIDDETRAVLIRAGFDPVQRLGVGAFSQVFLAIQNDLANRYVVLKVVRQPRGEPQMMAMLQHTNIVPIYSYHLEGSLALICMPYAGGVTLSDYLRNAAQTESRDGMSLVRTICSDLDETLTEPRCDQSPIPFPVTDSPVAPMRDSVAAPLQRLRALDGEQLAIWIFARLATALVHSHTRGVLHGDIKPANVLIRNDGEPALMDFNLSRSLQMSAGENVGGTLAYMSPENYQRLLRGDGASDARSDVYGLGVMLYEFLTGRLPFPRPHSMADIDIEEALKARQQTLAWSNADQVSSSLKMIVQRCLEFDPSNRYGSADQLQEDLERESQNRTLLHAPDPIPARVSKWIRRHPRSTSAASVATLLLLCMLPLVGFAVVWRNRSNELATAAQFESFVDESNDVLLRMMADPQRYQASGVKALSKPLEEFGLLDPSVIDSLFSADTLDVHSLTKRREVGLRHVVYAAIAESQRLKGISRLQDSSAQELSNAKFEPLDRLIAGAERISGKTNSRAVEFLGATRAELVGDFVLAETLTKRASSLPADSDNELYLEAVRLMADRKWSQARDMLVTLADRGTIPTSLRWTSLGRSQYQLGQYEEAKLSFTQSIERAPTASRLWLLRGMCYFKLRGFVRAESDFKQALLIEPKLAAAYHNLADMYVVSDRFEDAIELLNTGLDRVPDHVSLLLLRSRAHAKLGNEAAAQRDRATAYDVKGLSAPLLVVRAESKLKVDPQDAIADLEMANELQHGDPEILHSLANAQVVAGQIDVAIDTLDELVRREPDSEKAIVDRAVLLARSNRLEETRAELERAMQPPNGPRTLYQAACVCALLPDTKSHVRALSYLSAAVQRGYGSSLLATDSDLDSIRQMPGFQAIVRTTQLSRLAVNNFSESPFATDDTLPSEF